METAPKNTTPKTSNKEEFFFPGGLEFLPITIRATSREEAEAEYIKQRVPVESAASQPTDTTPKTPAPKSTSN